MKQINERLNAADWLGEKAFERPPDDHRILDPDALQAIKPQEKPMPETVPQEAPAPRKRRKSRKATPKPVAKPKTVTRVRRVTKSPKEMTLRELEAAERELVHRQIEASGIGAEIAHGTMREAFARFGEG